MFYANHFLTIRNIPARSNLHFHLRFEKYSAHTDIVAPLNTSDATKLWGDESLGHLPAQRPDNCVAISEAQGYRQSPIIDTTADFLFPFRLLLESGQTGCGSIFPHFQNSYKKSVSWSHPPIIMVAQFQSEPTLKVSCRIGAKNGRKHRNYSTICSS